MALFIIDIQVGRNGL